MILKQVFFSYIFVIAFASCKQTQLLQKPIGLVVSEGFVNPIGFYDDTPTLSWQMPASDDVKNQSGYQILVASNPALLPDKADLWNSEKQQSQQSAWLKYKGKKLYSRQKVFWQVKYWNEEKKVSQWSDVNSFELGLLNNADWKAKWIGLPTSDEQVKGIHDNMIHRPQYLRKVFDFSDKVASARLYITAKGVFDIFVNGKDVNDDVMPPGWTPYTKRIETITYDVTNLIKSGQNTLAVVLAAGWHSGRLGWQKSFWKNIESPKILCQLELTLADGSKQMIISDQSWKGTTKGPIRISDIYDGEIYDANYEIPLWSTNQFDDKSWEQVNAFAVEDSIQLVPKRHTTVKTKLEIPTKEILTRNKSVIFDLQQNMVGVPLVKVPMKKGDTLRIRFSEMLSPDGTFYTENYRSALSTDYYIPAKDGVIEWKPKFTFHGFRFVELTGFDDSQEPSKDWVTGMVQYSDFEQNGVFTSSHEKLNKLQSNIVWGLRGNFFDIPTDCPQRDERMGWTGDAQVFGPTSMFNADVYKFWASWLQSVRESQYPNGGIPFVVPDVLKNGQVSSGWGDVCVIIPWKIYFRTGDITILEENFETMKKWVAHHETKSKNYISNMNSFADWLQPYPQNENTKGDTSHELIGTAFFAHTAKLTAQAAEVLGRSEDVIKYTNLYKTVANAFEDKFFDGNGYVKEATPTQTSYLLALAFDLLSDKNKKNAKTRLLEKIAEADDHLRTGFLGTPLLSQVLDEMGEIDLMYKLLFNETYPSWFYSINQGASTIWERWNSYSKKDGYNPQSMNSLNHYAYGAIGEWMYERVAGIAPLESGYKKIRIAPIPNTSLHSAEASLNTPYGKVSSSWKIVQNTFQLDIVIPPNTTAVVVVPKKAASGLRLNGHNFENSVNSELMATNDNNFELMVKPGKYLFTTEYK